MMIASSYGTVSFLALALLTYFMGPLVSGSRPHDDSLILWDRQFFSLYVMDLVVWFVHFL